MQFPDTRWSLIGRLGERPADAAALLELYADSIARYLRLRLAGQVPAADLDDLVQDVLVQLLEHPEVLARAAPGAGSRFRHYLMTLAYNAARNPLRRQRRDQQRGAPVAEAVAADDLADGPLRVMDRAWAESVVTQAWNEVRAWSADGTLEPEVLPVLEDSLLRELPLRDIAAARGLGLATCQRRLARGRTALQQAITERLRQAGEWREGDDPLAVLGIG